MAKWLIRLHVTPYSKSFKCRKITVEFYLVKKGACKLYEIRMGLEPRKLFKFVAILS
jgi:hypothetical protein